MMGAHRESVGTSIGCDPVTGHACVGAFVTEKTSKKTHVGRCRRAHRPYLYRERLARHIVVLVNNACMQWYHWHVDRTRTADAAGVQRKVYKMRSVQYRLDTPAPPMKKTRVGLGHRSVCPYLDEERLTRHIDVTVNNACMQWYHSLVHRT